MVQPLPRDVRWTYDPDADAVQLNYVNQVGRGEATRSRPVPLTLTSVSITIDLGADGRLLGMEFLGVSKLFSQRAIDAWAAGSAWEPDPGADDPGRRWTPIPEARTDEWMDFAYDRSTDSVELRFVRGGPPKSAADHALVALDLPGSSISIDLDSEDRPIGMTFSGVSTLFTDAAVAGWSQGPWPDE